MTGQNPSSKCYQPLELFTQLKRGLDLTPDVLEHGPNALAYTTAEMAEAADFFLRTPTLTASNFAAL